MAENLREALGRAVERLWAPVVFLSGGVDSSILACLARRVRPILAVSLYVDGGSPGSDFLYAGRVARHLGISWKPIICGRAPWRREIPSSIRLLRTWRPDTVKAAAAMALALRKLRSVGYREVMTGDGADEIFVGYPAVFQRGRAQIEAYRKSVFSGPLLLPNPVAESMGIEVRNPFADPEVLHFAKKLKPRYLVGPHQKKNVGKWILRRAFTRFLPEEIVWREKNVFLDGSGISRLSVLPGRTFGKSVSRNGIGFSDPETAYLYSVFCGYFGAPAPLQVRNGRVRHVCNGAAVPVRERFCRACGSWVLF